MKKGLHLPIYITLISFTILTFSFISCDKNSGSGEGAGEPVLVTVNIDANSNYEDGGEIGNNNDQEAKTMASIGLPVESHTIELNDKFLLKAELIPTGQFSPSSSRKIKASASQNASTGQNVSAGQNASASQIAATDLKAEIFRNPLSPNVRYKLVVFKANGDYLQEIDYVYTQEASAAKLMLDGTVSYIFVAYSVNSTSVLPAITFSNPANKTLNTASVVAPAGNMDLMYFRRDLILPQNTPTNLNVVLKHKLTQITTTIDASQTEYEIDALSGVTLDNHLPNSALNLSTGTVTPSGTATTVPLVFPAGNSMIKTAAPAIINASPAGTKLTIGNLRITHVTAPANITPIGPVTVVAGFKYNMKLTIVPNDAFLTYENQMAVRINGKIWMRLNVGATASDPDANPTTNLHQGNYYQWGRKFVVGSGTSNLSSAPTGWVSSNFNSPTAWNTGTEAAPKKNITNDPCPTGFRVPTKPEMDDLLSSTIITRNSGSFTTSATNYNSAFVFTSKRKKSVKLTMPFQGYYTVRGVGPDDQSYVFNPYISYRGTYGLYFNSYFLAPRVNSRLTLSTITGSNTASVVIQQPHNGNTVESTPIRCIAGN